MIERALSIGVDPDDDPDLRIRKRAATAAVGAIIGASFGFVAVGILLGRPEVIAAAAAQIVVQFINLALFARSGNTERFITVTILVGLWAVLAGEVALGGVANAGLNLAWTLLTPAVAVLYLGARRSLPFVPLFIVAVVVGVALDPVVGGSIPPLPDALRQGLSLMNLLAAGLIGYGMVRFIDGERLRARAESDALLLNVLPASVAQRLKAGEGRIADLCAEASVLFADVVDFTPWAKTLSADDVVSFLDELFTAFDKLVEQHGLEKIKTVGDAYMAVSGVPTPRADHAESSVDVAIAMQRAVLAFSPRSGRRMQIRIGIASGPVVAGVIGQQKFHYDLWGDTVNTASRMESTGEPGCIQVTPETWMHVRDRYEWQRRDEIEIKGKGRMTTYLLNVASLPT